MLLVPIKITFYDKKTQEPTKEYSQSLITFDILIRASQLSTVIESKKEEEENKSKKRKKWWMWWEKTVSNEEAQINALMELVVDFFDRQFTVEQLRSSTDVSEVMTVLRSINSRASMLITGNPTRPRRTRH